MRKINTVREYINQFFIDHASQLQDSYPGINANILLDKYLQWSHVKENHLFLKPNDIFFEELLKGVPFEYILGNKFFFNHNFFITPDVLIPRNETEILVEDAVAFVKENYHDSFRMIEVGVGSGCILLSILAEIDDPLNCVAIDIDENALKISKQNFFRLKNSIHPTSTVTFLQQDRFGDMDGDFDLIVSNPPYIKKQDGLSGVHHQVLQYEPHVALFLDDKNYQVWFKDFFARGNALLKDSGMLMMEGHEDTLEELKVIGQGFFKKCDIKSDYTRTKRFLYLQK